MKTESVKQFTARWNLFGPNGTVRFLATSTQCTITVIDENSSPGFRVRASSSFRIWPRSSAVRA